MSHASRRLSALGLAGLLAICMVVLVRPTAATEATSVPSVPLSAVERHGALSVCGTTLCDAQGEPVQLRGMSTHGLQWYRDCVNDTSLDALSGDWGATVVRLSMYVQEGGYETDPEGFTAMMHELIEEVSGRGMYVIVDWHLLDPGDPYHNLDAAKAFFAEIAERHADKPNILYEVANEPNGVDWATIKGYHEEIIPVIRERDPDSVILLGTRAWSSLGVSDGASEQEIVDDPVDAENVMYTFHFYAASHGDAYLDTLSRAADQLPIFVTEFGTQEASGEGPNDFATAQRYLDLMAAKGIGWTNWNYSDDHRSGAVFEEGTCPDGPFAGTESLKEAGVWVRERIQGSGAPAADRQQFTHPGVLLSREQLDTVRERVNAGEEPWASAYEAMAASRYASLSWEPVPYEIVECGSYSDPNIGCTEEREDAIAAYTQALLWYVTQDSAHADKAVQIMNAWSDTIQDHTNSNAPLQTGWAGSSWARTAEIIRHTYDGWPTSEVDRFEAMLRDVYLPEIIDGAATKNGNWELIMMDAATGIAVFTDDQASFDRAIETWRGRMPANLYVSSDGDLPLPPPNSDIDTESEIVDYWHGQDTFVDGLSQETCRRFHYAGWGMAAASHTAETAYHQGIDLYAEVRDRLTGGMEFHADYDLGADVPDWLCGGVIDDGLGPTLEVAFNHYSGRLGIDLPLTRDLLESQTRPAGTDDRFLAWETLTHGSNA